MNPATLVHHANVANEVIREKVDDPSETEETKDESEELIQKGFKDDWVGWIMMSYMSALSVFWIIVLLVLSLDYYGYVSQRVFLTVSSTACFHYRSPAHLLGYFMIPMICQARHSVWPGSFLRAGTWQSISCGPRSEITLGS